MPEAKIPHPQRARAVARTKRERRTGFAKYDVRLPPPERRGLYGHWERLRRCLIFAGAENLPDAEIIEVILFTANPRADAELLVAELIECFGSLAEVLSADAEALAAVDSTPSQTDIAVTKDIVKAAAPLGITVHDHIIIGPASTPVCATWG
jgi:DNA repair protein RadC